MNKNQLLKGFQDFLPEVMIPRQRMIEKIISVFELYGFVPQDTPALEYAEVLLGKYGEDEKLIYRFQDNGGREVALRYDLTVPLARVVAMYRGKLPMPYKRYQISKVWRADKPQKGRFREFVQFDADVVGSRGPIVDAEVIAMMVDTMAGLGLQNFLVRVNDRGVLNGLAECAGVSNEQRPSLFTAIDKLDKIGKQGVETELKLRGFEPSVRTFVSRVVDATQTQDRFGAMETLLGASEEAKSAMQKLKIIFSDLRGRGMIESVEFDPLIARGLAYYTGTIYETVLTDRPEFGSVMSGGRYDELIKKLGGPDLPAIGTSVGVDRLFSAMQSLGLLPKTQTNSLALIANLTGEDQTQYGQIAQRLRARGVSCEIYPDPKKLLQQFQFAETVGIPFVLLLGEEEKKKNCVTIRTQLTRKQVQVSIEEAPATLLNLQASKKG